MGDKQWVGGMYRDDDWKYRPPTPPIIDYAVTRKRLYLLWFLAGLMVGQLITNVLWMIFN